MSKINHAKRFQVLKRHLNKAFGVNGWRFTKLRLFIEYRKDDRWFFFSAFGDPNMEARLAQVIQNNILTK